MKNINKIFANNPYEGMYEGGTSGAGAYANAAFDLADMSINAFKSVGVSGFENPNVDPNDPYLDSSAYRASLSQADNLKDSGKGMILDGLIRGASSGASVGGLKGAAIGAVAGSTLGMIGKGRRKKKAKEAKREAREEYNSYLNSFNKANASNQIISEAQERASMLNNGSLFF